MIQLHAHISIVPGYRITGFFLVCAIFLGFSTVELQASCGDYLHVKGVPVETNAESHSTSHQVIVQRPVHTPEAPCLNGECHSKAPLPIEMGTTSDSRIVDDVRSTIGLARLLNTIHPCDAFEQPISDLAPLSPHPCSLDKPPQISSV